jgi:hypothetical protein
MLCVRMVAATFISGSSALQVITSRRQKLPTGWNRVTASGMGISSVF